MQLSQSGQKEWAHNKFGAQLTNEWVNPRGFGCVICIVNTVIS